MVETRAHILFRQTNLRLLRREGLLSSDAENNNKVIHCYSSYEMFHFGVETFHYLFHLAGIDRILVMAAAIFR